ncbi:MAG TPA: hypothetical protein VGR79_12225 [Stellaceae bacterium]|nr:hypothetical protein [Stellaceae bacterium]
MDRSARRNPSDISNGSAWKAAALKLSDAEIATLDATTELPPVYPNWFIERRGSADRKSNRPHAPLSACGRLAVGNEKLDAGLV